MSALREFEEAIERLTSIDQNLWIEPRAGGNDRRGRNRCQGVTVDSAGIVLEMVEVISRASRLIVPLAGSRHEITGPLRRQASAYKKV